jgi:beta-lactamase class A
MLLAKPRVWIGAPLTYSYGYGLRPRFSWSRAIVIAGLTFMLVAPLAVFMEYRTYRAAAYQPVVEAVSLPIKSATPPVKPVKAAPAVIRQDSQLQTVIDSWVKKHGDASWGISIVEIGGRQRQAAYNEGRYFLPESIYKLFVIYSAQRRIAAGTLNPERVTATGQTVAECLDAMIITSDNSCGEAVAGMVGWHAVVAEAHAAGFGATDILSDGYLHTTPKDTTLFMKKLAEGKLLDKAQSSDLLSRMERQVYREGLPAAGGISVANKPGFNRSYLNDAGIVYFSGGSYAISVFSVGGSWSQIADLAGIVYGFMSAD